MDSIVDKTSAKIAQAVLQNPKLSELPAVDSLDCKKKELEIELLEMDKKERATQAADKTTLENKPKPEAQQGILKTKWYSNTSIFRLKVDEQDFKELLFGPKENRSPQEIQGMWQAYGQMRSTRITARAMVIATGVGGFGLWFFQQFLSQQKRELDEKEKEIQSRLELLDKTEKDALDAVSSAKMFEGELLKADEYVKDLCRGNVDCLNKYALFKDIGREEGRKKFEEKMKSVQQNVEKEESLFRKRQ